MSLGKYNSRIFNGVSGAQDEESPTQNNLFSSKLMNDPTLNKQLNEAISSPVINSGNLAKSKNKPDEKKTEDDKEEHLRQQVVAMTIANNLFYNSVAMAAYSNVTGSAEWKKFSDSAFNKLYETTQTTVMLGKNGETYYSIMGQDGNIEYYMMTDTGSVRAYDENDISTQAPIGAPTFNSMWGDVRRVYDRTTEDGRIEFVYASGEKASPEDTQKLNDMAAKLGKRSEDLTQSHEDFKKGSHITDKMQTTEIKSDATQDKAKNADLALQNNYTPENFLNSESAKIEALKEGVEAKILIADSIDEESTFTQDKKNLEQDIQKIEELKEMIAGKSPAEASRIMKEKFGDRWDGEKYETLTAPAARTKWDVTANRPVASTPGELGPQGLTSKADFQTAVAGITPPAQTPAAPTPKTIAKTADPLNKVEFTPSSPLG